MNGSRIQLRAAKIQHRPVDFCHVTGFPSSGTVTLKTRSTAAPEFRSQLSAASEKSAFVPQLRANRACGSELKRARNSSVSECESGDALSTLLVVAMIVKYFSLM
eukprot:818632_1